MSHKFKLEADQYIGIGIIMSDKCFFFFVVVVVIVFLLKDFKFHILSLYF